MRSSTSPPVRCCRRRGAATVELAIVGPTVILLILASIDLVRLYVARNTAQTVAYESAKFGLTPGTTRETIIDEAQSRLTLFCAKQAEVTVTSDEVGVSADSVTVQVEIPIRYNSWVLGSTDGSIVAECTVYSNRGQHAALDGTDDVPTSSVMTLLNWQRNR